MVKVSEKKLQSSVLERAVFYKWRCAHFRSVRVETQHGPRYMTPVAAQGVGFPDLCLVRPTDGRLAFVELKAEGGNISPDQENWLSDLSQSQAEVYVWRPQDWFDGTIERILR